MKTYSGNQVLETTKLIKKKEVKIKLKILLHPSLTSSITYPFNPLMNSVSKLSNTL